MKDVTENDGGFFFFLFSHDAGLKKLLESGPCYFVGKMLFLKKWHPHMKMETEQVPKIPLWVQFYNIPLE